MLRWFLGGRDAQSSVEVSSFLTRLHFWFHYYFVYYKNDISFMPISKSKNVPKG